MGTGLIALNVALTLLLAAITLRLVARRSSIETAPAPAELEPIAERADRGALFGDEVAAIAQRGDSFVIPHPEDSGLAIVFGANPEQLGEVVAEIPYQLAQTAVGTNALLQAGISAGEQAGMLVRLTPESTRRMRELSKIKDNTGAVLGVLRDGENKFRHVVKFTPQRSLQAAAGLSNALSAIAMQAQLAAIERAIADVASHVRSVAGKLDDRFYAELVATEGLLLETYQAASSCGTLTLPMWQQIAEAGLRVREHQEYSERQLQRLMDELRASKTVRSRRSWLKGQGAELNEKFHLVQRSARVSTQFAILRLWHLTALSDPSLQYYQVALAEHVARRESIVQALYQELLQTVADKKPGVWTTLHSPLDARRVRGMLDEVLRLLDEVSPPPPGALEAQPIALEPVAAPPSLDEGTRANG